MLHSSNFFVLFHLLQLQDSRRRSGFWRNADWKTLRNILSLSSPRASPWHLQSKKPTHSAAVCSTKDPKPHLCVLPIRRIWTCPSSSASCSSSWKSARRQQPEFREDSSHSKCPHSKAQFRDSEYRQQPNFQPHEILIKREREREREKKK